MFTTCELSNSFFYWFLEVLQQSNFSNIAKKMLNYCISISFCKCKKTRQFLTFQFFLQGSFLTADNFTFMYRSQLTCQSVVCIQVDRVTTAFYSFFKYSVSLSYFSKEVAYAKEIYLIQINIMRCMGSGCLKTKKISMGHKLLYFLDY